MAAANAERMTSEAELLNKSPLLINKIVAERLSDKIQVVMVPSDGKFFFANDVFKSMANESGDQAGDGFRSGARYEGRRTLRPRGARDPSLSPRPHSSAGSIAKKKQLETI